MRERNREDRGECGSIIFEQPGRMRILERRQNKVLVGWQLMTEDGRKNGLRGQADDGYRTE